MAVNPHTGKARTGTQLDALAQKLAWAGNFSKSCQAVCSDLTPSLGPHTLTKLQAKNPQESVDFDKTFWPSAADMDTLRQEDDHVLLGVPMNPIQQHVHSVMSVVLVHNAMQLVHKARTPNVHNVMLESIGIFYCRHNVLLVQMENISYSQVKEVAMSVQTVV